MAIVKMRKVRVAAAEEERKKLFRALLHLGCVEILPPEPLLEEEALDGLVSRFQEDSAVEDRLRQLRQGIAALQEIAHPRKKLFAPRQQVTESELLEGGIQETLTLANLLMERAEQLRQIREELARLDVRMARLMPWRQLDLPLEFRESRCTVAELGTLPPAANLTALSDALAEQAPVSALQVLQGDREQQRICLVAHRDQADAAMTVLKEFGFSRVTFEEQGAPEVVLHRLHQRRQTLEERQRALIQEVTEQSNRLPELERAYDAVLQEQATAREREKLLRTRPACYFEGWMPADQEGQISTALDRFICA